MGLAMDVSSKALLAIIALALIAINIQLFVGPGTFLGSPAAPTFGEWKAAPLLRKNAVKDRAPIVVDLR